MNHPHRAERLAISFPIAVVLCGLIGWITNAWLSNQGQGQNQSNYQNQRNR